jgi:hypothetical protein
MATYTTQDKRTNSPRLLLTSLCLFTLTLSLFFLLHLASHFSFLSFSFSYLTLLNLPISCAHVALEPPQEANTVGVSQNTDFIDTRRHLHISDARHRP